MKVQPRHTEQLLLWAIVLQSCVGRFVSLGKISHTTLDFKRAVTEQVPQHATSSGVTAAIRASVFPAFCKQQHRYEQGKTFREI